MLKEAGLGGFFMQKELQLENILHSLKSLKNSRFIPRLNAALVALMQIECRNTSLSFHCLDSITKRIKQLEDLITDNNASNLVKHVALLSTTIATGSALKAATTSITNQLEANTSVHSGKIVSIETLLDSLVILFDECSNSSLRREKTVSDFLELCKRAACSHPPTL